MSGSGWVIGFKIWAISNFVGEEKILNHILDFQEERVPRAIFHSVLVHHMDQDFNLTLKDFVLVMPQIEIVLPQSFENLI